MRLSRHSFTLPGNAAGGMVRNMQPLPLRPVAIRSVCDTRAPAGDLPVLLEIVFPFFISTEPPRPAPVPPAEQGAGVRINALWTQDCSTPHRHRAPWPRREAALIRAAGPAVCPAASATLSGGSARASMRNGRLGSTSSRASGPSWKSIPCSLKANLAKHADGSRPPQRPAVSSWL